MKDIIIIGGGIVGLATALKIKQKCQIFSSFIGEGKQVSTTSNWQ